MAGLLSDRFEDLQYRGAILPFGRTKKGSTVFATPGLLVDAIKSMELPGRALRGENISADDVTKMAMDTMGGGGLLSRAVPTGDVGGLLGINVFHGGPHRWAPEPGFPQGRPRLDKMGTGEGAQAYGHGFYSAEAENVGRSYRDDLTKSRRLQSLDGKALPSAVNFDPKKVSKDFKIPEQDAIYLQKIIKDLDSSVIENNMDSIIAKIKSQLDLYPKSVGDSETDDIVKAMRATYEAELAVANKYKDRIKANTGTLYKLDIPDADAAKFLDYDAPIAADLAKKLNEHPTVQRLNKEFGTENFYKPDQTGGDVYADLARKLAGGKRPNEFNSKAASEIFRDLDIPGLKYFDQNSRGVSNKSVFVDGADVRDSRFVSEQSAADIYLKHDGNIEKALNEAKQKFADLNANAKDTPQWFSARDTMRVLESWADDPGVLTIKDVGTRNYVTWDQDVLDRTKILERQ